MSEPNPAIRTDIPHSARIWNYWMGGKDNYDIDRVVGDASLEIDPDISAMAVQSRQFLIRAVSFLASEVGLRQFLDIGTGLPTMQNTHEVAQSVSAESKVVYVDNDPLVLAHARALLTSTTDEGVTTYIEADFHDPENILQAASQVLNFTQPIGVMFMGVLGHARSYEDMQRIIRTVMDAVPSGSYLVFWDGTIDNPNYVKLCEEYTKSGGVPYEPRTKEQLEVAFEGMELVEPGFSPITRWRTDTAQIGSIQDVSAYGGVARKP
ncbi:SAM-dependent methyltransferase [Nocardia uniformis]|uniref:SAM-dependent methyltransferase n=1 Tax=Nocardia uniformis TaxID=53432 RepID=A0A849C2Q4_9NOCA|nr:SAM-dependent methyltransferase [Nocardia uniformis]NNH70720.1 SAM-dependent methyltransferase [Nocardia uniformis]